MAGQTLPDIHIGIRSRQEYSVPNTCINLITNPQLTILTGPTSSYANNLYPWHQQVINASNTSQLDYTYLYEQIRFGRGHKVDIGRFENVMA